MKKLIIILNIIFFSLLVRLFLIESLPGEWFGDISNVHEYVIQILEGDWPFYFFQSPGPFYHYLIAPIIALFPNHGYETYKIASVIVSLLVLVITFFFVKEITSVKLALITTLTMSVSLWYLIWSRLGNSQIVIPGLVSLLSLFFARYVKKGRFADVILASFVASFGWYTYPQTFVIPFLFFLFYLSFNMKEGQLKTKFKEEIIILLLLVIFALPFVSIIKKEIGGNFGTSGYVGQKVLPTLSLPLPIIVERLLSNFLKTALMLHVRGDGTFRVNVSYHPHIDKVSGLFFFLGVIYFLNKKRRWWLFYTFFSMIVLLLPSISPAILEGEIPNSARTIAITPFVYLLVGAGILWVYESLKFILVPLRRWSDFLCSPPSEESWLPLRFSLPPRRRFASDSLAEGVFATLLVSFILAYVVFLNLRLYFVDYARGLPDSNLAPGKKIAQYVDRYPTDVGLYFSDPCCWFDWGAPDPKGVAYNLRSKRFVDYTKQIISCQEIVHLPSLIMISPKNFTVLDKFLNCPGSFPERDLISDGRVISKFVLIK